MVLISSLTQRHILYVIPHIPTAESCDYYLLLRNTIRRTSGIHDDDDYIIIIIMRVDLVGLLIVISWKPPYLSS